MAKKNEPRSKDPGQENDEPLPLPLVKAIGALDNGVRRGIVYEVDANGSMAFTSIHKAVNISKQDLAAHLKVLVNAGILYRKARKEPSDDTNTYSSYYSLTQFAIDLLKCLLLALDTSRCKELFTATESKTFPGLEWQPNNEKLLDKATKSKR